MDTATRWHGGAADAQSVEELLKLKDADSRPVSQHHAVMTNPDNSRIQKHLEQGTNIKSRADVALCDKPHQNPRKKISLKNGLKHKNIVALLQNNKIFVIF